MKSKLSLALAAALFALPLTAFAQDEAAPEAAAEEAVVEEVVAEESMTDEAGAEESMAEEETEARYSWNAALTSDYVFRGVSQSDEDPALQGGIDYSFDNGIYAGAWASNVDFGADGPDVELDTYVGWNTDLSDEWNLDLMLTRYNYYGQRDIVGDIEYNELIGALSWNEMYTFTLGYTNDVYALSETGMYYNLAGSWGIGEDYTLDAGFGLSTFDSSTGVEDYMDWSIGVSRMFGPINAALNYYGTDNDGEFNFGGAAGDRLVLTFSIEG